MAFKPGISGNAGGRPKGVKSLRKSAQIHTASALITMVQIMENPTESAKDRLIAAGMILDRAWGRPTNNEEVDVKTLSDAQLEKIINGK